jgi:hypothetical protein
MPRTTKRGGPASRKPPRPPAPENPWDRQPDETDKAYEAFRTYLEMGGERSGRGAASKLGKSYALISRWSRQHGWTGRVAAYEAEAYSRADEEALDEIGKRARRQAQIVQLNLEALTLPAKELLERLQRNPQLLRTLPLEELIPTVGVAARAIPRLVQSERLIAGQSTSNNAGHDGGPLDAGPSGIARAEAERKVTDMNDAQLEAFLLGAEAQRQLEAERTETG